MQKVFFFGNCSKQHGPTRHTQDKTHKIYISLKTFFFSGFFKEEHIIIKDMCRHFILFFMRESSFFSFLKDHRYPICMWFPLCVPSILQKNFFFGKKFCVPWKEKRIREVPNSYPFHHELFYFLGTPLLYTRTEAGNLPLLFLPLLSFSRFKWGYFFSFMHFHVAW